MGAHSTATLGGDDDDDDDNDDDDDDDDDDNNGGPSEILPLGPRDLGMGTMRIDCFSRQ